MNIVLNNTIGSPYDLQYPNLSQQKEQEILAELFEQLLLFDKITITTGRLNFPLIFLINHLGINIVEEMIERKTIDFLLWSPTIFTGKGMSREDGSIDETTIYGQPPLVGGSLTNDDIDPEHNIDIALNNFNFNRDRKRIFKRLASKYYIVPDDGLTDASESVNLIIEAYTSNALIELGLPYEKEPDQLNRNERDILMSLGCDVLETSLLSRYGMKSYQNYEHIKVCEQNLKNIGKAYEVSQNTSQILTIENVPDIKNLFLNSSLSFRDALDLRYKGTAKYYRKWINEVSESQNSGEITQEYLQEIKGTNKFFSTNPGKFVRNIGVFGLGTYLGNAIAGSEGILAGFSLGMLDTFWLENILRGNNPSMFIDELAIRQRQGLQN